MTRQFPFGQPLRPLVQTERSPKQVFVLGVYASAVHATWRREGKTLVHALAVASEPRIFWEGDREEVLEILAQIPLPEGAGTLEPAEPAFNGPSGRVLDSHILAPLGFTRQNAWLCDLLPEARLNQGQQRAIQRAYEPLREKYHLPPVTVPPQPAVFCGEERREEITQELLVSQAPLLVLLGDVPIRQYLTKVASVEFENLRSCREKHGYGVPIPVTIAGKSIQVLPLAHPRQVGQLGHHSGAWYRVHQRWMEEGRRP